MELPTYRAIGELALRAIGLSGLSGDAQSYRAIGLSGVVCYQGIGENFQSGLSGRTSNRGYRGKLPIGAVRAIGTNFQSGTSGLLHAPSTTAQVARRGNNPDWEFS